MTEKDLLRASDVAALVGVTTGRIYQLIAAGKLPAVRDGRMIRIPRAAWEQWLREQTERALSHVHDAGVA